MACNRRHPSIQCCDQSIVCLPLPDMVFERACSCRICEGEHALLRDELKGFDVIFVESKFEFNPRITPTREVGETLGGKELDQIFC